jgi:hypothetical protein
MVRRQGAQLFGVRSTCIVIDGEGHGSVDIVF